MTNVSSTKRIYIFGFLTSKTIAIILRNTTFPLNPDNDGLDGAPRACVIRFSFVSFYTQADESTYTLASERFVTLKSLACYPLDDRLPIRDLQSACHILLENQTVDLILQSLVQINL